MQELLPVFSTEQGYDAFNHTFGTYLPAVIEICRRHALPTDRLDIIEEGGSGVVFSIEDAYVLKMCPPIWADNVDLETQILAHLQGKLSTPTPAVLHVGELEGWQYFVMEHLVGHRLHEVLPTLSKTEQAAVYGTMGETIAQLHALGPINGALPVPVWDDFVQRQMANCQERQRGELVGAAHIEEIPAFLEGFITKEVEADDQSVLHTELMPNVWFVEQRAGVWQPSGLFDFGDGMIGDPRSDFLCREFDAQRFRAYLRGYGYTADQLCAELACRMLAYFLLHRYATLTWLFKDHVEALMSARSLEELALFGFPVE